MRQQAIDKGNIKSGDVIFGSKNLEMNSSSAHHVFEEMSQRKINSNFLKLFPYWIHMHKALIFGMVVEFIGYVQHGTFGDLRKIKKEMKFPILRMLELFLEREKNIGLTCESDHVTSLNWLEKRIPIFFWRILGHLSHMILCGNLLLCFFSFLPNFL